MQLHKLVLTGGFAALLVGSAFAADDASNKAAASGDKVNMIAQGNWLGTIAGSIQSVKVSGGSNTTSSNSSLTVGYMVTNNIGVGAKVAYTSVSSANTFTGFASARYYFDPQGKQLVPFVGPFIGYSRPTGGPNTTMYGGNLGVEYFLASNVSFTPSVNYFHTTGGGLTANTWSFAFGLTFWFAGK
ncbi:MAG TPA: outer membrane beta-barrel protein [Fimbriimonadaceae bacterium]|nr:outer membrane beta-barrel protein [Fimbriimonadaceae bacterium]